MQAIQTDAVLTGASTRADGSLSLKFATPELQPEHKTAFFELLNQPLSMLIQPSAEKATGLKDIKGEFDKKTPSQRIRAVLYCLWKYQTERHLVEVSFERYYLSECERIIQSIKDQLPEPT